MLELGWFGLVFCFMDFIQCLWWKWMGKMPRSQKSGCHCCTLFKSWFIFSRFPMGSTVLVTEKVTQSPPWYSWFIHFWGMCLSNLYIKRNASRELKLLRSKIIAFVSTLSFFSVFFFCYFFFTKLYASPSPSSHSFQT